MMQTSYPPLLPATYGTAAPASPSTWRLSHLLLLVNIVGFLSMVLLGAALYPRAPSPIPRGVFDFDAGVPLALLPTKWAATGVTPYKSQMSRGTCWDFASVGYLEWSYRSEGQRRGWLAPDEYVAFSEQAYGLSVMKLCSGPPDSPQQKNCRIAGDQVWNHSTEGGEVVDLYYLESGLQHQLLPHQVCPYHPLPGNDSDCPGFDAALATNPLLFRVKAVHSFYDDLSVKKRLASTQKVLAFSTPIVTIPRFLPCLGRNDSSHCNPPTACSPCPRSLWPHSCCVPAPTAMKNSGLNLQAEFVHSPEMTFSGGHAMLAVGYNDAFMTQEGHIGGFILKNSWADGPGRHSHSIGYFLHNHSYEDELAVCPNSLNPLNWLSCGNAGIDECLALNGSETLRPLELRRVNRTTTFYLKNSTVSGDAMATLCLWEHDNRTGVATDDCLPPMQWADVTTHLSPWQLRDNDPAQCGFYFMAYETFRRYQIAFHSVKAFDFEVEWHSQSFAAKADSFPGRNYSLLRASTATQVVQHFDGPFPFSTHIEYDGTVWP
ncbi:hypothetical protein ACHHYP_05320 [Achlya hypogyna]|uniref:Peptidase C1A papain C-terminal domain-containing protein n=1 Tax=Achlya hypogyna TaxID=1202772 RepID=A0A1V9YY85_ACHHY|nr:hypothetical protein ACHHYP_05320 [Achlya hypogyna]